MNLIVGGGGRGWEGLKGQSQDNVAGIVAQRFIDEFNYKHVRFHPVPQNLEGTKISFHLIHASDHDEAPKLMASAYLEEIGSITGSAGDTQKT